MSKPKYIVGIDLGTTHCVIAFTGANPAEDEVPEIFLLDIPQVINPGEVDGRQMLPSFLFLPDMHDMPEGSLALPWNENIDYVVGEYARERGAEIPARLVASAKSWLHHSGVDRQADILPWDAPADAQKVSPLEASARYLDHVRSAWNDLIAGGDDEAYFLENQEIYVTVPASFDAVARELTVEAAQLAGLNEFTLLEEPTAAFYAWLDTQKSTWRDYVGVGESVLVCDVGGGTTDFSLIVVNEEGGALELNRVAVGDHILLGGDNMDLTLAYALRSKLAQQGTQLDNWQFRSLWHTCRKAKEKLLSDPTLDEEPVVILGQGSSLIGGTINTAITREEIETVLRDGFFPICAATDHPQKETAVGIREMGLPYESDPAITRHLAGFLGKHVVEGGGVSFPSAVLFNGGVMKSDALRGRVLETLREWSDNPDLRELTSADLNLSVAFGATYYGLARKGRGIRVKAGTARAYYIGVKSSMPAVPGIPTPLNALCVAPFGMEEGSETDINQREFGLVVGENAVFHLLASTTRGQDQTGEVVEDWVGEIHKVADMEKMLPTSDAEAAGTVIPVRLQSKVTELGTLEVWMVDSGFNREWKLEFNIREEGEEEEGEN